MELVQKLTIWATFSIAIVLPAVLSLQSPLLAWRDPIYIVAGLAGVVAMAILLLQPILVAGYLPGWADSLGRLAHRRTGVCLIVAVVIHVIALWITSPPDVIDALLFVSPTPFSAWGVIAMWAILGAGVLAFLRRRLHIRPQIWRRCHIICVTIAVGGSVVHAMLIEGTMETISKTTLCVLVLLATIGVFTKLKIWTLFPLKKR